MVSRVLGFARDMIGSRVLGASHANDAFNLAFLLPNIFRRLFAEGAFSSGFVPLFSRSAALVSGVRSSVARVGVAEVAGVLREVGLVVALLVAPPDNIETVRY